MDVLRKGVHTCSTRFGLCYQMPSKGDAAASELFGQRIVNDKPSFRKWLSDLVADRTSPKRVRPVA